MLNPLKLMQLKQQADKIQKQLEGEEFTVEKGRIKIVISGNQKIRKVFIDGVEVPELVAIINDAIVMSQQAAAGKLSDISKQIGLG